MTICGVLDLETTGLKVNKGDQIIEFGMQLYKVETNEILGEYRRRFKPTATIAKAAQLVHGIDASMLSKCSPIEDHIPHIMRLIEVCDFTVAHNASFDFGFIEAICSKYKPELNTKLTFCTMRNMTAATFDGKAPSLKELCYVCGVEYDPLKAHDAMYDVKITADCLRSPAFFEVFKNAGSCPRWHFVPIGSYSVA